MRHSKPPAHVQPACAASACVAASRRCHSPGPFPDILHPSPTLRMLPPADEAVNQEW